MEYLNGLDQLTGQLTLPAERFCAAFVANGGNGRDAAKVAGYADGTGIASKLLANPKVQERISELRKDEASRLLVEEGSVREELKKVAFARLKDVADFDGTGEPRPKPFSELDEFGDASLRSIKSTEETRQVGKATTMTRRVEVEQHDKIKALVALGRMLGEVPPKYSRDHGAESIPKLEQEIDASKLTSEERALLRGLLLKAKKEEVDDDG